MVSAGIQLAWLLPPNRTVPDEGPTSAVQVAWVAAMDSVAATPAEAQPQRSCVQAASSMCGNSPNSTSMSDPHVQTQTACAETMGAGSRHHCGAPCADAGSGCGQPPHSTKGMPVERCGGSALGGVLPVSRARRADTVLARGLVSWEHKRVTVGATPAGCDACSPRGMLTPACRLALQARGPCPRGSEGFPHCSPLGRMVRGGSGAAVVSTDGVTAWKEGGLDSRDLCADLLRGEM